MGALASTIRHAAHSLPAAAPFSGWVIRSRAGYFFWAITTLSARCDPHLRPFGQKTGHTLLRVSGGNGRRSTPRKPRDYAKLRRPSGRIYFGVNFFDRSVS